VFGRCLVSTDVGSMLSWRHGDAPFLAPIRGGLVRVCAIFVPTLIADSIVSVTTDRDCGLQFWR
jgi:hypothetical protein